MTQSSITAKNTGVCVESRYILVILALTMNGYNDLRCDSSTLSVMWQKGEILIVKWVLSGGYTMLKTTDLSQNHILQPSQGVTMVTMLQPSV